MMQAECWNRQLTRNHSLVHTLQCLNRACARTASLEESINISLILAFEGEDSRVQSRAVKPRWPLERINDLVTSGCHQCYPRIYTGTAVGNPDVLPRWPQGDRLSAQTWHGFLLELRSAPATISTIGTAAAPCSI